MDANLKTKLYGIWAEIGEDIASNVGTNAEAVEALMDRAFDQLTDAERALVVRDVRAIRREMKLI